MRFVLLALSLMSAMIFGIIPTKAATLFGKVIEVTEGDVLTVMNMNRPARIRLVGIDAPEKHQAFGDVARQHLSDLVLGQNVVVEYSGIGRDGTIAGRVLFNSADMNAQMIRDGVAWFDPVSTGELKQETRDIYSQSELAARNEKRGLWQTGNAVAPWEYVRAEAEKRSAEQLTVSLRRRGSQSTRTELTNIGVLPIPADGSADSIVSAFKGFSDEAALGWQDFRFPNEDFSARVPTGGHLDVAQPARDVLFRVYLANDRRIGYAMFVADGPDDREYTNDEFGKKMAKAFIDRYVTRDPSCKPRPAVDVSRYGYVGSQLDLRHCRSSIVARGFSKTENGRRHFYIAAIINTNDGETIERFLRSISVGPRTRLTKSALQPKAVSPAQQNGQPLKK